MSNQPPLNPDALRVATTAAHDAVDWQMYDVTKFDLEDSVDVATIAAVSAYLAVAQPEVQTNSKPNQNFEVVNSVEELDALPVGSVIRGEEGDLVSEKIRHSPYLPYWVTTGNEVEADERDLFPARVLYRPEVES